MKKLILLELEISEELNDGDIEIENDIYVDGITLVRKNWEDDESDDPYKIKGAKIIDLNLVTGLTKEIEILAEREFKTKLSSDLIDETSYNLCNDEEITNLIDDEIRVNIKELWEKK